MGAKYLLDSDICILAVAGRGKSEWLRDAVQAIRPEGLAISVITYGEVREGALYSERAAWNVERWAKFTAGLDVLSVTVAIAEVWAEVRGWLRKRGNIVKDNDLLIASTALYFDMAVVTRNAKDFARVPGLDLLVM
jgi:predicted nucleic acid-binding protein